LRASDERTARRLPLRNGRTEARRADPAHRSGTRRGGIGGGKCVGRGHPRTLAIAVCSVVFGWTLASWLAGLVWSLRPIRETAFESASERGPAIPIEP
jgi:T4 superinfection immunity protein